MPFIGDDLLLKALRAANFPLPEHTRRVSLDFVAQEAAMLTIEIILDTATLHALTSAIASQVVAARIDE